LCNDFKCNVNTARMLFPPGEQVKGFGSDPFRPCWGPEGAEFYREETPAGVRNALEASPLYREETTAGVRNALKASRFYREETPAGVRNALKASRFYREETPAGVRRALKVPFYREETPLGSGADEAVGSSELFGAGSLRTQDACGPREGPSGAIERRPRWGQARTRLSVQVICSGPGVFARRMRAAPGKGRDERLTTVAISSRTFSHLLGVEFAARVQIVEVHDGVEDH
jgi:hypothetical protein